MLTQPFSAAHAAAVAAVRELSIAQATPVRVLHRRAAMTRSRLVHSLTASPVDDNPCAICLDLHCAAGTYVKELIGGDWGRTRPSLGELLTAAQPPGAPPVRADCAELDVLAVEMAWI